MSSKKIKDKYISKFDLPEILLSYDYDKNLIDLCFWLSLLSFVMLQMYYWISINYIILTIFFIGLGCLIGIWIVLSRKTLKKENSHEKASELISYFNEKGKRVNKRIKVIVESIKKAARNYDKYFRSDKINKYIFYFISLLFIPLNTIILIQYGIFNFTNINEPAI